MLALKITDIKDFTNKLFIGEVFDRFWLTEASITTFGVFSIDGKLQKDFFDSDACEVLESSRRTHALWKEVKPYCCSIIRGKHTPLSFKIILQLSRQQTEQLILQQDSSIQLDVTAGLYLNLQFKNHTLMCTTGTSMNIFQPGKQLDHLWESAVREFFRNSKIIFEEV